MIKKSEHTGKVEITFEYKVIRIMVIPTIMPIKMEVLRIMRKVNDIKTIST